MPEKTNYVLTILIKEDGSIGASYSENNQKNEDINLAGKDDKLHLEDRYETIDIIVNILRDNRLKGDEEYKMLGGYLYDALLNNAIGAKLHDWKKSNEVDYIKVELKFQGNANQYAVWPWEYMYCKAEDFFVATHPKIIVTRPVDKLLEEMNEFPLRILLVAPGPPSGVKGDLEKVRARYGLTLLAYENLFETINQICLPFPKKIQITPLVATEKPSEFDPEQKVYTLTIEEFANVVKSIQPHVIHFYGHGRLNNKKGQLAFTKKSGEKDWIDEDVFAYKVKESENIKFVFLQACETATSAPHKAISGVAQKLVLQSVPAVIAMQCRINQDSALRFTKSFYEELAATGLLDAAVHKGRRCIYEAKKHFDDSEEEERDFAFGIPVLYIKNRIQLFKQENPGGQQGNSNEKFVCVGCDKERPMTHKFCSCDNDYGEFVDAPNLTCIQKDCPRRLFRFTPRCPVCGLQNKGFVPKQKTA